MFYDKYAEHKKKLADAMISIGMTSISEEDFLKKAIENRKLEHIENVTIIDCIGDTE